MFLSESEKRVMMFFLVVLILNILLVGICLSLRLVI